MLNLFKTFGAMSIVFALIMISFVPIQGYPGALSNNLVEEQMSYFDLDEIIVFKKKLIIAVQKFLTPLAFADHLSLKPQNIPEYFFKPPASYIS